MTDRGIIVVEPERGDFGGERPATVYHVGVRRPDGEWDDRVERRCTLTPNEAWALAGLVQRFTELPIRGIDITEAGETIQ